MKKIAKLLFGDTTKTLEEILQKIQNLLSTVQAIARLNGAALIVENENGEILVGRATYGEKKFMLPGGAIERGELARHAAQQETQEEMNILVDEHKMKLIAFLVQRIKGVTATGYNFLYHTTFYEENIISSVDQELSDIQFMSVDEIIKNKDNFSLGYIRMILIFLKVKQGIFPTPFEGRLGDPVEYAYNGEYLQI